MIVNQFTAAKCAFPASGPMGLGHRISVMRMSRKLSMTDLAKRIKVNRETVSCWERGTCFPGGWNIIELCKLFEVSADYLLGLDDQS